MDMILGLFAFIKTNLSGIVEGLLAIVGGASAIFKVIPNMSGVGGFFEKIHDLLGKVSLHKDV